jgi:hypothetical protein
MRTVAKKLAMLLATVDAAIVCQKGKGKMKGCLLLPSLTCPDAENEDAGGQQKQVRLVECETRLPFWRGLSNG